MPADPSVDPRHWPVLAWIRLRVPEPPAPILLTGGAPPPPGPPIDRLEPEPVATDPTARLWSYVEPLGSGAIRLVWNGQEPTMLLAEYREPRLRGRLDAAAVRRFWTEAKRLLAELGPLPVEAADPRPG